VRSVRRRGWSPKPDALELLEEHGGPFASALYRQLWIEAFPEWRDASFAAQAPDGTVAAVALLADGVVADSTPLNYGGIVASRPLDAGEARSFLQAARAAAGARSLEARAVPARPTSSTAHLGGAVGGWTSVVHLVPGSDLQARWRYSARRAIRRARRGGGEVRIGDDARPFAALYADASREHWFRYPTDLLRRLASAGLGRCYDVCVDGVPVSSAFAVVSRDHWAWWLAAQNEVGRSLSANYLAVASLLEDAQRHGVRAVNLGISAGMPGVAQFKRRFDAVPVPVISHRVGDARARVEAWTHRSTWQLRRATRRRRVSVRRRA